MMDQKKPPSSAHAGTLVAIAAAASLIGIGLATGVAGATPGRGANTARRIPQPSLDRLEKAIPTAPDGKRVDLVWPAFSNPTRVTNPLFPISRLESTVLLGNVDGRTMRVETTLLPRTRTIVWNGERIETLVSQYVAYLDGRIEEVALDSYAQSDDGAVWYLGEDVSNYEDGAVKDNEGTWIAGEDGPAAMIMPARPNAGDVFRPENIPGIVFEEVDVKAVNRTVHGPKGRVAGAIVTGELHADGTREDKIFAPGYGEFSTGSGGSLEAIALAVPTDALAEPPPSELDALHAGALELLDALRSDDWNTASAIRESMNASWAAYRARGPVPPLLASQMNRALAALGGDAMFPAVDSRNSGGAGKAAIGVALAALDFQLRHRQPNEIDLARFDVWSRQLVLDVAGGEPGAVAGDVSTLEIIRDRIAHRWSEADARRIQADLSGLRVAVTDGDLAKAAASAAHLRAALAGLRLMTQVEGK